MTSGMDSERGAFGVEVAADARLATPEWSTDESRIAVVVNGNARGVNQELISSLDQILHGGDLFVSRRPAVGTAHSHSW
jgi:hypothetical protein